MKRPVRAVADAAPGPEGPADDAPRPVRRQGRPSKEEAHALHQHVLDVAERLFMRNGFEATSVDAIALEAGASKRTLYNRYPSKAILFETIVIRSLSRRVDSLSRKIPGATAERRLENLAMDLATIALSAEVINLMRVVIAESRRFPELARRLDESVRRQVMRTLATTGEIDSFFAGQRSAANIDFAADQLMSMTSSSLLLRALLGADLETLRGESREVVRRGVKVFLRGITAAPQA